MSASADLQPRRSAAPLGAADWLRLAAAPTFAAMALITTGGEPMPAMICAMGRVSPLGGMATMYLLMSAFHLSPWLALLSARRASPEA